MAKISIIIDGKEIFPWVTPSGITKEIISKNNGKTNIDKDLCAFALIEGWVLNKYSPKKLSGKDRSNSYLVKEREEKIDALKEQLNVIRTAIRNSNGENRLIKAI